MNVKILNPEFEKTAKRLCPIIGFELGEGGITVSAEKGERLGVTLKDGVATIYYTEHYQFFRELAILIARAKTASAFEVNEDTFFENPCVMLDASRGAVITVEGMKKFIDYLAVMGYGSAMLYTEDTIELPSRPHFGYLRGKDAKEEIKAIDDYAYEYGIELIPCIECYGHMGKYLVWAEAAPIKDTAEVLLAREEETFKFLDEWIRQISSCFRSRKIHIGMDEAWDMGRGKFLKINGYVAPFEIFNEYMERVVEITDKYGFKPMMWSDMYFRISSSTGTAYYEADVKVPEWVKEKIPKNVSLVFWHYRGTPWIDEAMLPKHMELGREVIHAGGIWGFEGHLPENDLAIKAARNSVGACRRHGVNRAMTTIWSDDGAECDLFSQLIGLSAFIENVYNANLTDEYYATRFYEITGAEFDTFFNMCQYQNIYDGREYDMEKYTLRFRGKAYFWQDILQGMYDGLLYDEPMSAHYAKWRDYYGELAKKDGKWQELYGHVYTIFDYLAAKTEIAEKIYPAYKANDKETLKLIAENLLPALIEKTDIVHKSHKARWFSYNKRQGWSNLDIRYGGVKERCKTAIEELTAYLNGEISEIQELAEERLPSPIPSVAKYMKSASPTQVI